MKLVSAGLDTHLAGRVTSLCTCWKATLTNPAVAGTVYGFTDHDRDVPIDEGGSPPEILIYQARGGYSATDVQTTAAMNVDNLEVVGMLNSVSITEEDLHAGLWDFAQIEIFQVNWRDLSQGKLNQRIGTLGEVSLERNLFKAELRGLMQAYSRVIGRLAAPGCDAVLGDARCKVSMGAFTHSSSVLSVSADNAVITFSDALTGSPLEIHAAGYYDYGLITFTSGLNTNMSMEIKTHDFIDSPPVARITLQQPMPYLIDAGSPSDTFTIKAGCGKRFQEDCIAKFNNAVNFRGFPHLPGFDRVIQVARRG